MGDVIYGWSKILPLPKKSTESRYAYLIIQIFFPLQIEQYIEDEISLGAKDGKNSAPLVKCVE